MSREQAAADGYNLFGMSMGVFELAQPVLQPVSLPSLFVDPAVPLTMPSLPSCTVSLLPALEVPPLAEITLRLPELSVPVADTKVAHAPTSVQPPMPMETEDDRSDPPFSSALALHGWCMY
jgi:hypothetical protein